MSYAKYQVCVDACIYCAAMCNQCADDCLAEDDVHALRVCIRLDRECAMVCQMTVSMMQLDGKFVEGICRLCADVCRACAEECEIHAADGMVHCQICAEACRQCAEACSQMAEVV